MHGADVSEGTPHPYRRWFQEPLHEAIHSHAPTKIFSTGILKISVVTGKREYRIYREFIGDTKKLSDKIYKKKHYFCSKNHVHQFYIILDKKANVHIL